MKNWQPVFWWAISMMTKLYAVCYFLCSLAKLQTPFCIQWSWITVTYHKGNYRQLAVIGNSRTMSACATGKVYKSHLD